MDKNPLAIVGCDRYLNSKFDPDAGTQQSRREFRSNFSTTQFEDQRTARRWSPSDLNQREFSEIIHYKAHRSKLSWGVWGVKNKSTD
jgi:hypothetical protein